MAYQYMKDHDSKQAGVHNAYRVLLHKLTGTAVAKPRKNSAINHWVKTKQATIETELTRRVLAQETPRSQVAALRAKLSKELFENLQLEEQGIWQAVADDEHEIEVKKWKVATEGPPSTTPGDRQK